MKLETNRSWKRRKSMIKMVSIPCYHARLSRHISSSLAATVAEIEELKKEAAAFREVRKGLGEEEGAKRAFEKVSRVYTDVLGIVI
jgi:hypothetical protein